MSKRKRQKTSTAKSFVCNEKGRKATKKSGALRKPDRDGHSYELMSLGVSKIPRKRRSTAETKALRWREWSIAKYSKPKESEDFYMRAISRTTVSKEWRKALEHPDLNLISIQLHQQLPRRAQKIHIVMETGPIVILRDIWKIRWENRNAVGIKTIRWRQRDVANKRRRQKVSTIEEIDFLLWFGEEYRAVCKLSCSTNYH